MQNTSYGEMWHSFYSEMWHSWYEIQVHNCVSIDAIHRVMGWVTSCERHTTRTVRYSNRLMSQNNTRLPKVILQDSNVF